MIKIRVFKPQDFNWVDLIWTTEFFVFCNGIIEFGEIYLQDLIWGSEFKGFLGFGCLELDRERCLRKILLRRF